MRKNETQEIKEKYDKLGLNVEGRVSRDIANFVGSATGRGQLPGGIEQAAVALNTVLFSPRLMADSFNRNGSNLPRLQLGTPGCGFNWTWHGELAISSQTNMDADPSTYLSCVHLAWTRERHHRVNLRKGIGL